ncbi:ankyrin repeat domain-containing protein [Candidatus Dependentiae bacterium]|nr:ankyrin repeat domain-containing protein [Candidatus Dependentiae bacterium]
MLVIRKFYIFFLLVASTGTLSAAMPPEEFIPEQMWQSVVDEKIVECIETYTNFNPNFRYFDSSSALHYAAKRGFEKTIVKLCELGAAIDIWNREGETPLHYAIKECSQRVIEHLIKYGANINLPNKKRFYPIHYAIEAYPKDCGRSLFILINQESIDFSCLTRSGEALADWCIICKNQPLAELFSDLSRKKITKHEFDAKLLFMSVETYQKTTGNITRIQADGEPSPEGMANVIAMIMAIEEREKKSGNKTN